MTELLYTPGAEDELMRYVPGFLRRDRNTGALAKAVMHMVFGYLLAVQRAIVELTDVEHMSEEALDERACSLGIPWYDFRADVAKKRMWNREAEQMQQDIGTMAAITRLMNGVYAHSAVEEWTQYEAEPYHFRVTVFGKADPEIEKWARNAIDSAKNLRSVLDGFFYSDLQDDLVLEGRTTSFDNPFMVAGDEQDALEGA